MKAKHHKPSEPQARPGTTDTGSKKRKGTSTNHFPQTPVYTLLPSRSTVPSAIPVRGRHTSAKRRALVRLSQDLQDPGCSFQVSRSQGSLDKEHNRRMQSQWDAFHRADNMKHLASPQNRCRRRLFTRGLQHLQGCPTGGKPLIGPGTTLAIACNQRH